MASRWWQFVKRLDLRRSGTIIRLSLAAITVLGIICILVLHRNPARPHLQPTQGPPGPSAGRGPSPTPTALARPAAPKPIQHPGVSTPKHTVPYPIFVQSISLGEYSIRIFVHPNEAGNRLEILRDGRVSQEIKAGHCWIGGFGADSPNRAGQVKVWGLVPPRAPACFPRYVKTGGAMISRGRDLTGDGRPDLVIGQWIPSWHGTYWLHVFPLGVKSGEIPGIPGAISPQQLIDLDGDKIPEVRLLDAAFAYWRVCFANSPMPKVILKYRNGRYRLAPDLMRRPVPSRQLLAERARSLQRLYWQGDLQREQFNKGVLRTMTDLIYTGNADSAWRFLAAASPGSGWRKAFLAGFRDRLAGSPHWPELSRVNGFH